MDLSGMRKQYSVDGILNGLSIQGLGSKEPLGVFKLWFDTASKTKSINEANAMTLATATKSGKPSSRIVLLKSFSDRGFVWYTNYSSQKGKELVRVEGRVERLSEAESTNYFHSRPKGSQIGACVSSQSSVIKDRQVLEEKEQELLKKHEHDSEIPKPADWGGYLLIPERFEFWQGRSNRLHDRIVFRKRVSGEEIDRAVTQEGEDDWLIERLSP